MTRPRVLFVDDEPRVLDGLRRSLRTRRAVWEMSFVTSGEAALERLAEEPHDVLVSDMRMPEMDGAELLTRVSNRHPEVARVVLSGHTEPRAAIKVAYAGHRFLSKPSDPEQVIGLIDELMTTTASAAHARRARRIAGAVRGLPSLPGHVEALSGLTRSPDVDPVGLTTAARHDVGLTAKLLQLSSSAFFGVRDSAVTVDDVVRDLGVKTLQELLQAGLELWSAVPWAPEAERYLAGTWRHAMATAWLIDLVASPGHQAHARAAALLQDVGRFACLPGIGTGRDGPADLGAEGCGDVPFRDIGVELLHLWGVPPAVVGAVAERDIRHRPVPSGLGVAGALRVAHLLIQQTDAAEPGGTDEDELAGLLAHPQLAARGAEWPALAREAAAKVSHWPPA